MSTLTLIRDNQPAQTYPLAKTLTTVGRSAHCDIALDDSNLLDVHCHIHADGHRFEVIASDRKASIQVNGKQKRRYALNHADRFTIGDTTLEFSLLFRPIERSDDTPADDPQAVYELLFQISTRLLQHYETTELLDALLDGAIAATGAENGFLALIEGETPRVRVTRHLARRPIEDTVAEMSDSIVSKVICSGQPVIVSDALNDSEFSTARSILHLQLASVICVPLKARDTLIGLIYLGNNQVAHLFDRSKLQTLTIFAAQASLILQSALLTDELRSDRDHLAQRLEAIRFGRIIGSSEVMTEVFRKVEKVASTDVTVLVTGETGTGKELIAQEIHERSGRAKGPFISVNCGAIPENLLESELFGHVRGAFTGAVNNRRGRFQMADGGTLFLDEIGELPLPLQVKLLRALQEHVVTRVGAEKTETVDIRIVAATNKDLSQQVEKGQFREDLFYRLNVVAITLPPLRQRGDDILLIAKYFLDKYCNEYESQSEGFSPAARVALRKFPWPGNIRQLENHIRKAVVLGESRLIGPEELDIPQDSLPTVIPLSEAKENFSRDYVREVLARNDGNRTKTAQELGVDPRTIFRYLERDTPEASG